MSSQGSSSIGRRRLHTPWEDGGVLGAGAGPIEARAATLDRLPIALADGFRMTRRRHLQSP